MAPSGASLRRRIGLATVFAWFAGGGLAHFVFTDAFARIVPPYVPAPAATVLVSGALELAFALGLLSMRTRRAAGIGLLLLTVAVTPANVHMLLHAQEWPSIPYWALIVRLPLQVALLALIAWSTGVWSPSTRWPTRRNFTA